MYKHFLKLTSVFFIVFISFSIQSCKIYDTDAVPELDAIASAKKVKVITTDGKTYKFKKLLIEEDRLVGLSKPRSKASKHFPSEKFKDSKGREMEKISINRETVKEINVYDKKKSRRRTTFLVLSLVIGLPLLGGGAAAGVAIATY